MSQHSDLLLIVDRLAEDYCPAASIERVIRTARSAFYDSGGSVDEIERRARVSLNQTASDPAGA